MRYKSLIYLSLSAIALMLSSWMLRGIAAADNAAELAKKLRSK